MPHPPPRPPSPITQPANKTTPLPHTTNRPQHPPPPPPRGAGMGTWHNPNPTEGAQVGWGHNSHTPQMRAVVHPLMPLREPQCAAPHTAPPPQSAPCPIATHHCSRSRCVTRCPHPAQRWLWAEPRVAAVWGGGGIGHRGAGLGYGMEGDASAHCAPRCDGGCGGDAVCGAQSCSGTAQRAKGGGGGGGHQSRGDFLPLFGLIPTGAAVRGPPKHRGCSHPTERSAEQLQQCSAGGAALLPAQSRKWVPVQQKGQQSPQPSPPPPPFQGAKPHSFLCSTTA